MGRAVGGLKGGLLGSAAVVVDLVRAGAVGESPSVGWSSLLCCYVTIVRYA